MLGEVKDDLDNDCNGKIDDHPDCRALQKALKDTAGCSCASGSGPAWVWLVAWLGLAARRRGKAREPGG